MCFLISLRLDIDCFVSDVNRSENTASWWDRPLLPSLLLLVYSFQLGPNSLMLQIVIFYLAQFLYSSVFVIIVASALYLSALSLPPPIILPHHYGKDTRQREFTVGDGSVSA